MTIMATKRQIHFSGLVKDLLQVYKDKKTIITKQEIPTKKQELA